MESVIKGYGGIDVMSMDAERLPIAVAVRDGDAFTTLPLGSEGPTPPRSMGIDTMLSVKNSDDYGREVAEYLMDVQREFGVVLDFIGINGPRNPAHGGPREADQALEKLCIPYVPTPDAAEFKSLLVTGPAHLAAGGTVESLPLANELWMLRSFALFSLLSCEWMCMEISPAAIMTSLSPDVEHPLGRETFDVRLAAFAEAAGWDAGSLESATRGGRDASFDAVMGAWIPSLPSDELDVYGDGGLDTIWNVRRRGHLFLV